MKIAAIPNDSIGLYNGLVTGYTAVHLYHKIARSLQYHERVPLEQDTEWRQPIPYSMIQAADTRRILLSERKPKQDEKRLHGKMSLGIGGHIEDGEDVKTAFNRELAEEIGPREVLPCFIGVLVTSEAPIDTVHIGLFFHVMVDTEFELTHEQDKHQQWWKSRDELMLMDPRKFETWSWCIIDEYLPLV